MFNSIYNTNCKNNRNGIYRYKYHIIIVIIYLYIMNNTNLYSITSSDISNYNSPEVIENLIISLVNHNDPPIVNIGNKEISHPLFNNNYNWSEVEKVRRTIRILIDNNSADIFPFLIMHLDDKRYALTTRINGSVLNMTISDICRDIAYDDLLFPYNDWPNTSDIPHVITGDGKIYYPPPHKNLKQWCMTRNNKKLWEMQIEIGEWAINTIKNIQGLSKDNKYEKIKSIKNKIETIQKKRKALLNDHYPYERVDFTADNYNK
jgi:hypothetical protein